ncbi:hypothetical protein [Candidatus Parabeggiatoa sp. HSG14]|uniref:hypothetical protein n=1 Tax=Candidatus Parabeggiatoa sp. HSG14 TaxID=3055593 RepID=UPI0025A72109|nr:hypothetical protein [Thiotrichales bacterium HSG14]
MLILKVVLPHPYHYHCEWWHFRSFQISMGLPSVVVLVPALALSQSCKLLFTPPGPTANVGKGVNKANPNIVREAMNTPHYLFND